MKVTEKCDIYSFGVVLLELLTGRRPIQPIEEGGDLVTWVKEVRQSTPITEILDKRMELSDAVLVAEMELMLKVALFCTDNLPASRPTMRQVVQMLLEISRLKPRDSFMLSPQ
jgi:serine/threonine protein kinase